MMTVEFEIVGQKYLAVNGGPLFKFNRKKFNIAALKRAYEGKG